MADVLMLHAEKQVVQRGKSGKSNGDKKETNISIRKNTLVRTKGRVRRGIGRGDKERGGEEELRTRMRNTRRGYGSGKEGGRGEGGKEDAKEE